jgi:glycosyltransferase involved in cell wall biosynthesis
MSTVASPGSVLFIVENLPVPFDRRVWMEATTLQRAGWAVSVICPTGRGCEADFEILEGVRIHRHGLPPEGNGLRGYLREYGAALWGEARLARRVWDREQPLSAIHICNPPDLLFLIAGWYKAVHGVRVIYDQHDIMPELFEAKFGRRGGAYWLVRLAERLTYATADLVIATNDSYRRIAVTRGRKRGEDVVVVRSAPDLSRFRRLEDRRRVRRGRPHCVGYVGVMGPQEGLDHLLRAIRIIIEDHGRQDISFMLVGDGPSRPALQKLAKELGVSEFVEFTGRVRDEELIRRLVSCDVCVNPDPLNPFNDASTMNKVLEYMSLGLPVVQFDLTEGRRSAGDASAYAMPNDERDLARKLLETLDDAAARERMAQEGMRRMKEDLEWCHQAPKLLEAYDRLRIREGSGRRTPSWRTVNRLRPRR